LANSACDLVSDRVRRVSLGQSAAKRARRCFAPESIARRYLAIAKANQPT